MAAPSRIYIVAPKVADVGNLQRRLVRATHPSLALRHVAADQLLVTVASQEDLVALTKQGVEVESINEQHELQG